MPKLYLGLDAIMGVMTRILRNRGKKKIVKFEIRFEDQSDLPGDAEAMLSFLVWYSDKNSEPKEIEHFQLKKGFWLKM